MPFFYFNLIMLKWFHKQIVGKYMEALLDFFVHVLAETTIGIAQSNKSSKALRLFVVVLMIIVMILSFALAYIYRGNIVSMWMLLLFGIIIAIFLVRLCVEVIKIKQRKE